MTEQLSAYIARHRQQVEIALSDHLPVSAQLHAAQLNDAMRYALFPGGKRWRPMLTLLGAELIAARAVDALPAACAMEYLHTSSIILDDLPAMDDADMRRGRKALHLVYGESIALLASLALLNESYALLARNARTQGHGSVAGCLIEQAAAAIGSNGMIGGQVVDLVLQGVGQGPDALISRNLKTTALMRLTMMAGAVACGASEGDARVLGDFGEALGMAYQICDDLLDELGQTANLGKPAKQDSRHARSNHVVELGVEGAHRLAAGLIDDARQSLYERFGDCPQTELLSDSAALILRTAGRLTIVGT